MKTMPLVFLLFTSSYSFAVDSFGDVHCLSENGAQCRLQWSMTSTNHAGYVLERFDMEEHVWQPYETLPGGHAGVTRKGVPPDTLYRIRSCQDYIRRDSCIASVVVWVPFIAKTMDELPDTVQLSPGAPLFRGLVQKNLSMDLANFDYNAGRLVYIRNAIDPDDVTSMTPPPVRHFDYEVVGGKVLRNTGRDWEQDASKISPEIFIHNEMWIMWERWIQITGAD